MDNSEDRQNLSNPVIVAPYDEPDCHWRLDDRFRATDTISKGRRPSGNYMSVPKTHAGHATDDLFAELEATGVQPHKLINDIRKGVTVWRRRNYPGAPHGTRRLLEHWAGEHSVPRPFFAQRDAVESLAFVRHGRDSTAEEARKALRDVNDNYNDSLPRMAVKMATGTGKTLAMAMWACCLAAHTKRRVNILVLTPNLTVTSRLKELDPSTAEGAALYRNLLPRGMSLSGKLNVVVTNYHRWQRRDASGFSGDPGDLKPFLSAKRREISGDGSDSILETDAQMLSRILGSGGAKENWFVFNDEAHHCYRPPKVPKGEEEQAALWYNALRTLQSNDCLAGVYDFSATPMYLKLPQGLAHPLFPWIISDYPLIEAVEAGLTKIPRVPVSDDQAVDNPLYRNIFANLKPGERNNMEAFHLPGQLSTLIEVIYEDYCQLDKAYEGHGIKPVFIVVANTKKNARSIWETIAGRWGVDGVQNSPGSHTLWSNVSDDGTLKQVPPTLLTYSAESKDGEATVGSQADDAMKRQRALFCRRDRVAAKDAQAYVNRLFDTVGKPGQPGEHIRYVVSVNQLTEGWDARTVTHILGFRAFRSELLCEQVAGRALRRTSFPGGESGRLEPEYARILGVPFTFMRGSGPPPPPPASYRVYTLPGRKVQRIEFPNVIGFRPVNRVEPVKLSLSPERMKPIELADPTTPTETLLEGSAGEAQTAETQPWTRTRVHYVIANDVARHVIEHIEQLEEQPVPRAQLFATTLKAVVQWMKGTGPHSTLKCNTSGGGDRFSGRMMLRIGQEAATVPVTKQERLPCPRATAT